MRPPAFQFYASDFLSGTYYMSQAEAGCYIRLLANQWDKGPLEADAEMLERLAGGPVPDVVLAKFSKTQDGRLFNERMEKVRKEQEDNSKRKSEGGKRGADARWHSHGIANATAMRPQCEANATAMRFDGSPSPTPTPTPKEEKRESAAPAQLPLVPEPEQPKATPTPKAESKPDSLDAVHDFFCSNGGSAKEADKFYDFFASNGWKVSGKAPMKDWHAAARNWMRRASEAPRGLGGPFRGAVSGSKTAMQENIDQLAKAAEEDMRQLEAARAARIAAGGPQPVPIKEKMKW